MTEKSSACEIVLNVCGQAPGAMSEGECTWIFQTASTIREGGCWVNVGPGLDRAFLAAGMGLPPECRIIWVTHRMGILSENPGDDESVRGSRRSVEFLQTLRPDLRIDLATSGGEIVDRLSENESIDSVFLSANAKSAWISEQIAYWQQELAPSGRLSGCGWGSLECSEVTPAVAQALPGVSSGAGSIWTWTIPQALGDFACMPRLSIVVATTGRETLTRTLASIRSQRLLEGDEVLLVHDGEAGARTVIAWNQSQLPGQLFALVNGPHSDWGAAARTTGQSRVRGTHILWQDDDDYYLPGAFDVIRREIVATPEAILLFRIAYPNGALLWRFPGFQLKNVSTQMYVIPSSTRLGCWGTRYQGDFDFILTTVASNPGKQIRFVDKPTVMYSRPLSIWSPIVATMES
jgi:hypothetical protein